MAALAVDAMIRKYQMAIVSSTAGSASLLSLGRIKNIHEQNPPSPPIYIVLTCIL